MLPHLFLQLMLAMLWVISYSHLTIEKNVLRKIKTHAQGH